MHTVYLVYATPSTIGSNFFETLHVFRSWSVNEHIIQIIFVTFSQNELSHFFSTKVNTYNVSSVCNSSYSFTKIPLKLYRSWFMVRRCAYCLDFILRFFVTFLQVELSHFSDQNE